MHCHDPLVERNLAALHDRPDRHGKLFPTFGALVEARTMGLSLEAGYFRGIDVAAMGANRPIRPALGFEPFASCGRVNEARV